MFSWSKSGKPASAYPGNRHSTAQAGFSRQEHLQSYLNDATLKPSTRRVSKDDSTYDTVFQTKSGHALILRVHVPPGPGGSDICRAPAMQLVGVRASHSWLDGRMRVTGYAPTLSDSAWSSSGVKLGAAVNAVVQYLQLNPPEVIEITDESLKRIQSTIAQRHSQGGSGHQRFPSMPPKTSSNVSDPPPSYHTVLSDENGGVETEMSLSQMSLPPVPTSFPELETMSRMEMQELLDDDDKLKDFVGNLAAMESLNDLRGSIFKGNVETAEANLKHEEDLGALHAEVKSLQESLQGKIAAFRKLEERQNKLCAPPDKQDVIKRLTVAKREAYDESEELASTWLDDGDMEINDFLERFMERRVVHHIRAAKIERLNDQM